MFDKVAGTEGGVTEFSKIQRGKYIWSREIYKLVPGGVDDYMEPTFMENKPYVRVLGVDELSGF